MMFNSNGNNGASIKVALYARVSSEDQVERETIQNQVQIANPLCPAMGLEIVASYLDDGVSGTIPLEKRPQGGLLLEDAKKGKFKQVVVYRLDRIGRTGLVILSA
jgi:site-specific DNA recombinase